MKKILSLLILLLLVTIGLNAKSKKHFQRGIAYFETRQYKNAAKYFELALRKDTTIAGLEYLAKCYVRLNLPEKAEFCLQKAFAKDTSRIDLGIELARSLKMNGNFKKAKEMYLLLAQRQSKQMPDFISNAHFCDSVLTWTKSTLGFEIFNLKEINTEYSEISPTLTKGKLVFASNREGVLIESKSPEDNMPFYDLYVSELKKDGKLKMPILFSSFINSIHHESSASFSSDGEHLYFTQTKFQEKPTNDTVNRPKLFKSEFVNGAWKKPQTFIFNDSAYAFSQPCIDYEGKMFFFASDMKGGYGGSDIYISLNIKDKWTDPINLGPIVNTPGNEIYPFYDSTGTLYFSSDYHLGMGGFDIFKATQERGDFTKVENMKPPFNSEGNDFGFFFDLKNGIGYFSSDRKGGKGLDDIYMVSKKKIKQDE